MKKNEWISEVEKKLEKSGVRAEEVKRIIGYYVEIFNDRIEDGMTEEQAVSAIGSVEDAVQNTIEDFKESPKAIEETIGESDRKEFRSSAKFSKIVLNDVNTRIRIERSEDDNVHVSYLNSAHWHYSITTENNVLCVCKHLDHKLLFHLFSLDFRNRELVVYIPKDYSGTLNASTSNASLNINHVETGNILLKTSNGKLILNDSKFSGNLNAETHNASIVASEILVKGIDFTTSNGSIDLSSVDSKDNIVCKTSNASVKLKKLKSEKINIKTSNARIEFSNVESQQYVFETSNARISGMLPGSMRDYTINSHTSNARNTLPERLPNGDKELSAVTSNGSINVQFDMD